MHTTLTKLVLTYLATLGSIVHLSAQKITNIKTQKDQIKQLELALKMKVDFQNDTIGLIKNLHPLLELADQERSIPLKWAYYLLMADGFSIAYDQVNPRSNAYYRLASELVGRENLPELKMIGNIRQGYYMYTYREVQEAFPYFLLAAELEEDINAEKIPLLSEHYSYIANFYSYIGDQEKAITYLKTALPYTEEHSRQKIDMTNAIGVYYKKAALFDKAYPFYKQALEIATVAKDSVWMGIISGNLADYEWEKGNEDEAIALVKQNIELSLKYKEVLDAMRANLEVARMYAHQKKWDLAEKHIAESTALMADKPYFLVFKRDAAKILAEIAAGKGQKDLELTKLKEYLVLKDSLEARNNNEDMQKIYWQWEIERYEQANKQAESKRKQINQTYQYVGTLLILGFIIIVLLINRAKTRIQFRSTELEKEQLALKFEKQLLDQELSVLKNSLQEFTDTVRHNDHTIRQLRKEIHEKETQDPLLALEISESLSRMLESHIMTDERWLKFKHVFDKVYPEFLETHKLENPKLSESDLRLIALMKLDLNNRSMSDLLGVSIEGVKKAKQRLKKKVDNWSVTKRHEGEIITLIQRQLRS